MENSREANQSNSNPEPSNTILQNNHLSLQHNQDFFCFLKNEDSPSKPRPFFSENGLSQDIIKVTNAEPDVCLEAFYALYHTLYPQIASQSDVSLKDAWTDFIGGSILKGILCPPEKLIGKKKPTDIKKILSENKQEKQIFQDINRVISSISHLQEKVINYYGQLHQKEEIVASLNCVEGFYKKYRDQVKMLGQALIDASSVSEYETSMSALVDLLEPKAVMLSDIFQNHWAYHISRNKAQKLLSLDENRRPLENDSNEPSNHRVAALPEESDPLVYFKANGMVPIQPEKEYMLYSLYRQLQIPVPETALLVLTNVFQEDPDYFYAVQASEAVIGTSALEACHTQETIFEQGAYALQVIGALLTNPSDGSFKNFKYSPQYKTLVSIDNDLVFKPEFTAGRTVNVKSILYLLPQMNLAIPKSIKTLFTTLDPILTILLWLKSLSQKNNEYNILLTRLSFQKTRCFYQNLLPQSEVISLAECLQQKALVDPDLHNDSFYPQILVSENLLNNLLEKLQIIEKTLIRNDSKSSSQILFEEVSPILGKYYRKLRSEFADPEMALNALWGENRNGVDYSNVNSLLEIEELPALKNDSNGPPEMFLNQFKSKLVCEKIPSLDKYIQRQSERKKKNLFNLHQAREELVLLIQEGLTSYQSSRDIVDFWYSVSKMPENNFLIKEVASLLSNLPHPELKWLFTLEKYFKRDVSEKAFSIPVTGAFMKQRTFVLTESAKQYVFDNKGNIKKSSSLTGRSNVTSFPPENPEFFLKQYPELPGYEFASILFMRMIGISHLPYQELVVIDDKYPALLTQAVNGNPVFKVWQDSKAFTNLDPFHTGLLIIAAMLLNPEDGKEDNFILTPDQKYLIPIDNDHCFLPSTFQKGKFWNIVVNTALQTKTLLFCLDEMNKPIPNEVKQHIINLDSDSILQSWLQELVKIDHRYYHLVDETQRKVFLENGTVLRTPFYLQFIQNLYWKVNKIQDLLRSPSEPTPFDLLKAVEPFAARCYQSSFQPGNNTLQSRFKAATDQLYNDSSRGSRMSILNTQLMVDIINVPIRDILNDSTYHEVWPSAALETLKQLIQAQSQTRKLEHNLLYELDDSNEENLWTTLFGKPLLETTLNNFLKNPQEGLVLKGSRLITRNNLRNLFEQTPDQGAKIKFLSLPNSPLLDQKTLKVLTEACPNLGYLNLSGCLNLEEIVTRKGEWPLLARVEAKDCFNLRRIASSSPIKILRVGTQQNIDICIEKHILDVFAISTKTNQLDFWLTKEDNNFEIKPLGKLFPIDTFKQKALLDETYFQKYFTSPKITLGSHSILSPKDLEVFITLLDLKTHFFSPESFRETILQLNLANLKMLLLPKFLAGEEIFLRELIQGNWPKLVVLTLSNNEVKDEGLAILAQGEWPFLIVLRLSQSQISKKGLLNFALNTKCNDLREITLSETWRPKTEFPNVLLQKNWELLTDLDLSSGQITQSDIEAIVNICKWPNLKHLNLSSNEIYDEQFTILSQGNWPLLETLNMSQTRITNKGLLSFYLNIKWPKFREVNLPSWIDLNLANNLHKRKFSEVERLELNNSKIGLAEIDLIANRYRFQQIKSLDLSNNDIPDEGLSLLVQAKWLFLKELNLQKTNITSKGIEIIIKWQRLRQLNISDNEIFDEGILLFSQAEWPLLEELSLRKVKITPKAIDILANKMKLFNLKKLDISENTIQDEGLKILASAHWPAFQHLVYYETQVTLQGNIALLENMRWPNFQYLEHSLTESFYNYNEDPGKWLLPKSILAMVPMYYNEKSLIVTVLDANWHNSKEMYLSLRYKDIHEKVILLPLDKLHQLQDIKLSLFTSMIQLIVWPSNLKMLSLSHNSLSFEKSLQNFQSFQKFLLSKFLQLEHLNLGGTGIGVAGIEILIETSNWPNLKTLNVSANLLENKGLIFLCFGKWPLLENLDLGSTAIDAEGIQSLVEKSKWPKLKTLNVSENHLGNQGLQILASGKWPLLENLNLRDAKIEFEGIMSLLEISKWPNLKALDISGNDFSRKRFRSLSSSSNWYERESFNNAKKSVPNGKISESLQVSGYHSSSDDGTIEKSISAKWPGVKLSFKNPDSKGERIN